MPCEPPLVSIPHFGCCGTSPGEQASIVLRATVYGYWEHSLSNALHPTPANVHPFNLHQAITFRIELSGGRTHTQVARCPNIWTRPVIVSTDSTAWDITTGIQNLGGVVETPTSYRFNARGFAGVTPFTGTATYTMSEPVAPLPIIESLYTDLQNLNDWLFDSVLRERIPGYGYPQVAHPIAFWSRSAAGLLFESRNDGVILDFFGNFQGVHRSPAFGGNHLFIDHAPFTGVPFTYGNAVVAGMAHEIGKVNTGLRFADEWAVRSGTGGARFYNALPAAAEAELRCALNTEFVQSSVPAVLGVIVPPPSYLSAGSAGDPAAVPATDARSVLHVHARYSFPPMVWPGGVAPSCRPDLAH